MRGTHSGKAQYVVASRSTQVWSFSGVTEARTRASVMSSGTSRDWPTTPTRVSATAAATVACAVRSRAPPDSSTAAAIKVSANPPR